MGTVRSRATGLCLALILLVAAVPAVLDCCLHGHLRTQHSAALRHLPLAVDETTDASTARGNTARGCADQAAPTQNPYIETASGGGGGAPATRSSDIVAASVATPALVAYGARRTTRAADSTGPPLWLSTCVSRT
ncbi:hypothetical protein KDK95_15535 [Actinospica sp. MGRD01-02]|uniref:Uncharacterized protein n=1 Tax=Actinospica acidithermotolerans TaxID=2828514 RepID=A0A941EA24_9ACTN|nr:hypothetical protein [Actinospica acidithermotolerans]MBR7827731.1 hypothetical protein [Actinospica acidithermotolerans]